MLAGARWGWVEGGELRGYNDTAAYLVESVYVRYREIADLTADLLHKRWATAGSRNLPRQAYIALESVVHQVRAVLQAAARGAVF